MIGPLAVSVWAIAFLRFDEMFQRFAGLDGLDRAPGLSSALIDDRDIIRHHRAIVWVASVRVSHVRDDLGALGNYFPDAGQQSGFPFRQTVIDNSPSDDCRLRAC